MNYLGYQIPTWTNSIWINLYLYFFISCKKDLFHISKNWTRRNITGEGFRVDIILVPPWETLRRNGVAYMTPCEESENMSLIWFNHLVLSLGLLPFHFALFRHLGLKKKKLEFGCIYYKMNAFLQKFFIDYGLLISSHLLLPIKDIITKNSKIGIYCFFCLITFSIFIELQLKIFLCINLNSEYW